MKKIALALAFFLAFIAAQSQAQTSDYQKFRFGFQASPTWSKLTTSDKLIESAGTNWGLKLGVMAENYFAPNYAIVTGLGFGFNQGGTIQNGYEAGTFWTKSELSSENFRSLPKNAKLHYRMTYVEVPIGLKMRGGSNEDSRMKFYAEAPVFTLGFLTKALGDVRGTNEKNTEDENIREDVNGLALSWGLGGGIEYEVATSATLVAGISYQKQFTDLTDDGGNVLPAGATEPKSEKSKGTLGIITLRVGVFF
ncbi:MAG: porin family protein [Saprospiraceae bacterium]